MASSVSSKGPAKPAPRKRLALGRSPRRFSFEKRIRLWLYLMGLPLLVLSIILLSQNQISGPSMLLCVFAIVAGWALIVSMFTEQIVRPMQTLSNVVAALREDDYSFRARGAQRNDALGDLALEVNALAGMLQSQRTNALETMALLERIMASIESPVLAFGPDTCLLMINAAGQKIFGLNAQAVGRTADTLHLSHLLETADSDLALPSLGAPTSSRWIVKRSSFRLRGIRHTLLMLSDVSKALREEERLAWERLIRVLGHEINNSLTPIKSIAGSLRGRLDSSQTSTDFEKGLAVIENRAESLNRFLQAYRQLMGLPTPKFERISLLELLQRVVHLEAQFPVGLQPSPDVLLEVDSDQIEQALINLLRNAVEASQVADRIDADSPEVQIRWETSATEVVISIQDNGLGLTNSANLFVPFYTTKPNGTGIGLVLAQQIAEAHSGSVHLSNRSDAHGCVAQLKLPIVSART